MAGNQYQDGKPVFIMKCQAGNNSDGTDTRELTEIQTKKPNHLSHQWWPPRARHVEQIWPQHQLLDQLPAWISPELRLSCEVPLQISPSLRSMFKSRVSGQPAGPDDARFGKVMLPKTPPAAAHSSYCWGGNNPGNTLGNKQEWDCNLKLRKSAGKGTWDQQPEPKEGTRDQT